MTKNLDESGLKSIFNRYDLFFIVTTLNYNYADSYLLALGDLYFPHSSFLLYSIIKCTSSFVWMTLPGDCSACPVNVIPGRIFSLSILDIRPANITSAPSMASRFAIT